VQNRFCLERGRDWKREVALIMYTHVSKCKNDKIKEREKMFTPSKGSSFIDLTNHRH
jgi:hypothetical protein